MDISADKRCCVPKCGKSRSDGVILHSFPHHDKDPTRFRSWLYAVGGEILELDNQKIFKYRKVCHNHFQPKFHTSSKRLAANAIPTINMPGDQERMSLMGVTNRNVTHVETESTIVQSQPSLIHDIAEPKPSTSKGDQERMSLMDVTNRNVTHVETESSIVQSKPSLIHDVAEPQPSSSKGLPKSVGINQEPVNTSDSNKVKKSLTRCYSTETSFLKRQIKTLQATKDRYAAKLKKAMKLSQNKAFLKATRNFHSVALMFIILQFREVNKDKMGRRFTKNEKNMALSLYKQGPRAYRWLSNIFVLPSPMTLSRMISEAQ